LYGVYTSRLKEVNAAYVLYIMGADHFTIVMKEHLAVGKGYFA
jgi:hypothetical protein